MGAPFERDTVGRVYRGQLNKSQKHGSTINPRIGGTAFGQCAGVGPVPRDV